MTGKRKLAGGCEISEAGLLTGLLDAHVKFVKMQFRKISEEGFSDYLVDVCSSCIHRLVKNAAKKEPVTEVEITDRINEVTIQ